MIRSGDIGNIFCPPKPRKPWPLSAYYSGSRIAFYAYGRQALADALKTSGVRKGDSVLLPEFICKDVLSALDHVGARPDYYPVNEKLEAEFDPDRFPFVRAVVAVNYFGFAQPLDRFRRLAMRTGAIVIEDNAHGLLSRAGDGTLLGQRGDLGILSIRKQVPLPDGAALIVNSLERIAGDDLQQGFAPKRPELRYHSKGVIRKAIGSGGGRAAILWLRMLKLFRRMNVSLRWSDPVEQTGMPAEWRPTQLLSKGISAIDPDRDPIRRRRLYQILAKETFGMPGVQPVYDSLPPETIPYGFPFYCPEKWFPPVVKNFAAKGLDCITWPELPDIIKRTCPPRYRQLRMVPFLW